MEKEGQVNSGFTLFELMTALGIFSVLAAIVIPSYLSWMPKYRLKNAALDLFTFR